MDYSSPLLLLMQFLCPQFNVYTEMGLLQHVSMNENYGVFLSMSSNASLLRISDPDNCA